ncbi:MAG: hypothetical protein WAS34_18830 [Thiolinea sp.]
MSIEKQYYTPKLSEFKQGFLYEHYIPIQESWVKETFFLNDSHINIVKYVDIQTEDTLLKVRVKSLDHYDIIEAGWEFSYEDKHETYKSYTLNEFVLTKYNDRDDVIITDEQPLDECTTFFDGTIKNYNKLLDVMEMLDIKKEE